MLATARDAAPTDTFNPGRADHASVGHLVWDFDGTLAHRPGGWSGACASAARRRGFDLDPEALRPHLGSGFPWHTPEEPHPDIASADGWWQRLHPVLAAAFEAQGIDGPDAASLARDVRRIYTGEGWRCYEEAIPVLERSADAGWTHLVLSNHVPELPAIVDDLGLSTHIDAVHTSAAIGYEKPHPRAFDPVLERIGRSGPAWMIGDSYGADVAGAAAVGLPAILVRTTHGDAENRCADLTGVPRIIGDA